MIDKVETAAPKKVSFWHPATLIATCLGVGKAPFAPGTWGSLFTVIILILTATNYPLATFINWILSFIIGTWAASHYVRATSAADPQEIVVDEYAGLLTAYHVAIGIVGSFHGNIYCFILVFITFRIFDIIKPWPVSWADRKVKGGIGVMLDDIFAGVYAGLLTALVFSVYNSYISN